MNRKKPIASSGSRTKRAPVKRNMFAELMEGLQALEDQRLGKRTLRTHDVDRHSSEVLRRGEASEAHVHGWCTGIEECQ